MASFTLRIPAIRQALDAQERGVDGLEVNHYGIGPSLDLKPLPPQFCPLRLDRRLEGPPWLGDKLEALEVVATRKGQLPEIVES